MSVNNPWTPEEDQLLTEKFASCQTIKELMPLFPNRSYNAIRSRASKYLEIKIRKLPTYDRQFFDVPNERNCAIAGFVAADAGISEAGRLTFNLSRKDRTHLENVVKELRFTGKIYDYDRKYSITVNKYGKQSTYDGILKISVIQMSLHEAAAKLAEHWNITPVKTYTLRPPRLTCPRLVLSYLSGLIDGDGSVIVDSGNEAAIQYAIYLIGTKEIVEWTKSVFDDYVPNSSGAQLQATESRNIFDYKVSSVKTYWLAKLFLSLDIPRMARKWDILRDFVQKVDSGEVSNRFKSNMIRYQPRKEILDLFGISSIDTGVSDDLALEAVE